MIRMKYPILDNCYKIFASKAVLPLWKRRRGNNVVNLRLNASARVFWTLFTAFIIFFMFSIVAMMAFLRVAEKGGRNLERLRYQPSVLDIFGYYHVIPDYVENEVDRDKIWSLIRKAGDRVTIPETAWTYVTESYPKWVFKIPQGIKLADIRNFTSLRNSTNSGDIFKLSVQQFALYDPEDPIIETLINDASTMDILEMEERTGGTQIKLSLYIKGHGRTIFKPGRFKRSYESDPNYFYFGEYERHNAEIATFHLDRILGFYRAPPVVGRWLNITRDVFEHAVAAPFNDTLFTSPAGNKCFHGTCKYFCDPTNAICGKPDMIEGAVIVLFPTGKHSPTKGGKSPWRRSYNKNKKAAWETNNTYCHTDILTKSLYRHGRLLNDIIDTHVLDFLTGNLDRHHYERYLGFNDTFLLHFDHGRSFGRIKHDEISILAPIYQCCRIRYSTFIKLLTFFVGPTRLSHFMRRSTSCDPLAPILAEGHFEALDRRVAKIMLVLAECVHGGRNVRKVIIDDGF